MSWNGTAASGGSASETANGPAVELAALVLNLTLGAFDAGLLDETAAVVPASGSAQALAALADEMRKGGVDVLIVAGANPVYDAPAALDIAGALAKVGTIVSLGDRLDETAQLADLLARPARSPAPLTLPALERCFKGRGPWKKGLPTLLQTLEALGRAQTVATPAGEAWHA